MYRKNYTSYSPVVTDISRIPLEALGSDYNSLVSTYRATLAKSKSEFLAAKKAEIARQYAAVNEGSYEGNFEEYNLETLADNRFKDMSSMATQVNSLVEEFITSFSLKKHSSWFLPQMLAAIANELQPQFQDNDKLNVKQLVVEQIKSDTRMTAIWLLCKHPTRSSLLDKQTHPNNRNYCSLVPLMLAAFKKYNNIAYSAWNKSDIHGIVEPQLAAAMMSVGIPKLSKEELLELRTLSLTPKTGKDAGNPKNPETTYSLYPPAGSILAAMPMLLRIMLCQTWCAHPVNRTEYMILDPNNWDNMPEALVDVETLRHSFVGVVEDWAV